MTLGCFYAIRSPVGFCGDTLLMSAALAQRMEMTTCICIRVSSSYPLSDATPWLGLPFSVGKGRPWNPWLIPSCSAGRGSGSLGRLSLRGVLCPTRSPLVALRRCLRGAAENRGYYHRTTLYTVDDTYWQIIHLSQKQSV